MRPFLTPCVTIIAAFSQSRTVAAVAAPLARNAAAFIGGAVRRGGYCCSKSSEIRRRRLPSTTLQEPPPDDDPLKWEKMWMEGEVERPSTEKLFADSPDVDPQSALRSEVRVVTFDLDNTLWKTGKVISAANDELATYLADNGIESPVRTEVIMGELFKKDKARYCPMMEEEMKIIDGADVNDDDQTEEGEVNGDESKSKGVHIKFGDDRPVLLTQLRKDALRDILIRYNDYGSDDATQVAEEAFEVWTRARHDAIPSHYAESVVESLELIKSIRTSSGRPVVVGAITDGNSDPRTMPELGPYFDFVVNSESVGVSKPDKRVYMAAVEVVASLPDVEDVFETALALSTGGGVKTDLLEEAVGPWWVHVGDDFIKDIVAAKELKMRSIWSRELVRKPNESKTTQQVGATEQGEQLAEREKKRRDVADLVRELAEMKVVEMYIGAEDFLMDSIHREFADAIVDQFSDVARFLNEWHEEGLCGAGNAKMETLVEADTITDDVSEGDVKAAIADVLTVVVPDEDVPPSAPEPPSPELASATKFCMYCGTKLPMVAKFCSSCGEKQPELK